MEKFISLRKWACCTFVTLFLTVLLATISNCDKKNVKECLQENGDNLRIVSYNVLEKKIIDENNIKSVKIIQNKDLQVEETFPYYLEEHITSSLERPRDEEWKKIRPYLDLLPGMAVADVGCGTGGLTFYLAHEVGPKGKVYALDVQKRVLNVLRPRLDNKILNPFKNVVVIHNQPDDTFLPPNSIDLAMLIDVHFHYYPTLFGTNQLMITSLFKALKPGGQLMIVDGSDKIPPEKVAKNIINNYQFFGFTLEKGPDIFMETAACYLTFRKPLPEEE